MAHSDDFAVASRKASRYNPQVDHSKTVVLKDNSKTRVEAVLFYIAHNTSPDELCCRINTYRKNQNTAYPTLVEEKSISLDHKSCEKLFKLIEGGLNLRNEKAGDYLVVRLSDGTVDYSDLSPELVAKALIAALEDKTIIEHLRAVELTNEFVSAIKTSIHLSEMRSAISALRGLLDSGEKRESSYQEWCFNNSWAFGSAYIVRDDVRNISASDSVDMLLPRLMSGYRDIVELKSPKFEVLHFDDSHRDYYFSAEVSKVVGQCHRYLDVLSEEASGGLRDHSEIVSYCPRAIVVIGRSHTWDEEKLKALHGLNSRLNGIQIMTYDNLLAQCEQLLNVVSYQDETDDDTIPF